MAVYLLGNVQFRLDDGPPLPLEAGKTSALLAYLAMEANRPHLRQTLAELLWPERADAQALSALRFALSNLRAVLHDRQASPTFLLVDRSSVQINPQAEVWVDATAFQEQAAAREAESRHGSSPSLEALHAALTLYRGPFLHGFNLGDSLDFESWALREREQLERRRARMLHLLGAGQEAAGSYAQAAEAYRTLLEFQPWDEDVHRCLMRVLAANGEHSAALAQYAACCRALGDLGIEPGRVTHTLYQRIKQETAAGTMRATSAEYEPTGAPFVARERELAHLATALERVLAGQGQVVLITGEAGSGKTTLLNAFAHQCLARHPGLLVTSGRCDAYAGVGQPYQPFIESIQMLAGEWETFPGTDQITPELQERLQHATSQVARALVETAPYLLERVVNRIELAQRVEMQSGTAHPLPDWYTVLLNKATPAAAPTSVEAGQMFKQVTNLFTALAQQQPLVLLLDDLQWIDASSAALLFHLARHMTHSRLLLVAAYRPGEVDNQEDGDIRTGQHPLVGIVTELQRYGGDIRVDLDHVDEQGFVAAFLAQDPALHPNRFDATFHAALARHTGGNPLFTIELLRNLKAHDAIQRAADGSWVSSPTLNWAHLPERVEAAIAGRIAHMPVQWRDWLTTASVEGESFTAEVLARVHGLDVTALRRNISSALGMGRGARRLVQGESARWVGKGDRSRSLSRYRFRHILFQVYLYQQLDPVERARRHAAVGFALEDLYGDLPEERARRAAELARHFEACGLAEKAAAYHLEAGRQAVYMASPQSAVTHYRRGLALLTGQPNTPERDRLEIHLYLALSAPFLSANAWGGPERQEAIRRALELLQTTGRVYTDQPAAEWDELLLALHAQADWLVSQGEFQQAAGLGEHILTLAREPLRMPQALAHRILGLSHLFQGHFPEARRQFSEALAVYDVIAQPVTLPWIGSDLAVTCRAMLGFVLAVSGHLDQAWEQGSRSLQRARRMKHLSALGIALIFACEVAVLRGDLVTLQSLSGELLDIGQTEGMRFFLAYGWAADGYAQATQAAPGSEQAKASLELIRRGMRLWESTSTYTGYGMWIVRMADACLQAGDIAAGLAITTDVLASPTHLGMAIGLAQIYRLHGELLLRQASPDRRAAEACFYKSLNIAQQQAAHTLELHAVISLAQLWQPEQPEAVRRRLADTYTWFTEGLDTPDLQTAAALLAES